MKLMITTAALALVLPLPLPAAAQYGTTAHRRAAAAVNGIGTQTAAEAKEDQAVEGRPEGDHRPSDNGEQKGLCQRAAKVAAAQAVATTPDDKYAIGQLQLRAAVAEKDNAVKARRSI